MKPIKLGIIFIVMPICVYCLLGFFNNGFLGKKLFLVSVKIKNSAPSYPIPYPIVQEDGTIRCERSNNFEFGVFSLSYNQIANLKKIGSINEPSYYFANEELFQCVEKGSLVINNYNNAIKIQMCLPLISEYHRNYSGEYELIGNNLILHNANYDFLSPFRILLFFGLMFFSVFIGFVSVVIGIRRTQLKKKLLVS
jgi:hypothetical protein